MNEFNKFYKFGSVVKPKASLYCLGIVFFICITNIYFGIYTVSILTLLETFIVSFIVALIEYALFKNYDSLSKNKKKTNTIMYIVMANIIIIPSSIIFGWFPTLPSLGNVILFLILQASIVAMRYSIYVVNLSDTKDLNSKLRKYQKNNLK